MKKAHTPGPWDGDERGLVTKGEYRLHIANVAQTGMGDAAVANTKLIAAAPELLAGLRDALDCIDGIPEQDRVRLGLYSMIWVNKARAAVRKATA